MKAGERPDVRQVVKRMEGRSEPPAGNPIPKEHLDWAKDSADAIADVAAGSQGIDSLPTGSGRTVATYQRVLMEIGSQLGADGARLRAAVQENLTALGRVRDDYWDETLGPENVHDVADRLRVVLSDRPFAVVVAPSNTVPIVKPVVRLGASEGGSEDPVTVHDHGNGQVGISVQHSEGPLYIGIVDPQRDGGLDPPDVRFASGEVAVTQKDAGGETSYIVATPHPADDR